MAVAFRSASANSQGNTLTATVTKPAGVVDGDLLLAIQTSDSDGTLTAMTAPAGWTLAWSESGKA